MAVSLRHALAQALAVCGILAVCPAFVDSVPSASSGTPSTCAELRAWAEAYRDATPTLDEFARFDRTQRRAIFGAVAPGVRAALWREHFLRLSRQPTWSDAQLALFREALPLITPALYEQRPDALKAFQRITARVDAVFVVAASKRVWFDLAGPVTPKASNAQIPWCDCSLEFQECWGGAPCNGVPCKDFGPGCGPAGMYGCNGRCAW